MTDPHHLRDNAELAEQGGPHSGPSDAFVRTAQVLKVVDGDTLRLKINLGWGAQLIHDCRLAGCNTPEARGPERPAGNWVTQKVHEWLGDRKAVLIHSRYFRVGKFGRCLCDVWIEDDQLNGWLLGHKYAWPMDAGGSHIGPRNIDALSGIPDEIRRQVREAAA